MCFPHNLLSRYTRTSGRINEEPCLITDHRQLIESVGASPIAMVVSNPRRPDNPLEVVNDAFCELTGYDESEIMGRNCRFLAGDLTQPAATEQIRASIRAQRPILVDILNYRRDGTPFRNGVMITPLFDTEGGLALTISLWESLQAAEASAEWARDARQRTAETLDLTIEDVNVFDLALRAQVQGTPRNGSVV